MEEEQLIVTPSVEEAWAYLQAWGKGSKTVENLFLLGPPGIGKEFLITRAIRTFGRHPTGHLVWDRLPPPEPHLFTVVPIGPPEEERKEGVLREWGRVRGYRFSPSALHLLVTLPTWDLDLLRSLAERAVFESGGNTFIEETDILRTLHRLNLLPDPPQHP